MTLVTDLQPTRHPKPYRWTVDHYHRAVDANIFEGQSVELLEGVLFAISPEGIPHAGLSSDGADYLREKLGKRAKIREGKPITLPNASDARAKITSATAGALPTALVYHNWRSANLADIKHEPFFAVFLWSRLAEDLRKPSFFGISSCVCKPSAIKYGTMMMLAE